MRDIDTHSPHFQPKQAKRRQIDWPALFLALSAIGVVLFFYLAAVWS